jgi:dihydrofolate reductase
MRPLALIAAFAVPSLVIGNNGGIPWREPEDMKQFKENTVGHAIIMGRKTWDSLKRPLPLRRSIVISRTVGLDVPAGVEVYQNLSEALDAAYTSDSEPRIIGGAEIYRMALPVVSRMLLTEIHHDIAGDTVFPDWSERDWLEESRRVSGKLVFRALKRRGQVV